MKKFKNGLHVLITAASMLSFLGGWAILAHSPKPVQPLEPLPTLEPVQAFNANSSQQVASSRHSRNSGFSAFTTRGS
jgi:hypothetical protein